MRSLKFFSLFLFVLVSRNFASAQYCQYGTVDTATCGCTCPSSKFIFSGWACYCDNTAGDPSMLFSYNQMDPTNGCNARCPYGTNTQYNWWCGAYYGAVWDVAGCGCKCPSPKVNSGGVCVCPSSTPVANATQDSWSCAWNCNAGYQAAGSGCYRSSCTDQCPSTMDQATRDACLVDCELQ